MQRRRSGKHPGAARGTADVCSISIRSQSGPYGLFCPAQGSACAKLDRQVTFGPSLAGRPQRSRLEENGKIIGTQQQLLGGGKRAVQRFLGGMLAVTLTSVLLLGCTGAAPSSPRASQTVPSSLAAIQSNGPGTGRSSAPRSSSPAGDAVPMELESAKTAAQTPIYWLGATDHDVFLYREFRDVPSQGDPITTALTAMTREQPLDPDYFNPWTPADMVGASLSGKNVITVDISSDAFNRELDEGMAQRAVAQLVFTATAAAVSSGLIPPNQQIQVVVLVDGKTDYRAFGHVPLGEPLVRDNALLAPVWLIDPQEGARYQAPTVTVYGRGSSPDSQLKWELLRLAEDSGGGQFTTVRSSGVAALGETSEPAGTFRFELQLPPGRYELRMFDYGGDVERFADTKIFNVSEN